MGHVRGYRDPFWYHDAFEHERVHTQIEQRLNVGQGVHEIARALGISDKAVSRHKTNPPKTYGRARWGNLNYSKHIKLDQAQADEIRVRYAKGDISQPELAREYGVSQTTIWDIVRYRTW